MQYIWQVWRLELSLFGAVRFHVAIVINILFSFIIAAFDCWIREKLRRIRRRVGTVHQRCRERFARWRI